MEENTITWKSSNPKVCKVFNNGSVGRLEMHSTGKCKITCIAKNGKKYTCNLTVTGGKTWGGLTHGYRPTLSQVKKHGYYKDINKLLDYGNVIFVICSYDSTNSENNNKPTINLKNGNKVFPVSKMDYIDDILYERYPDATIKMVEGLGDYLLFTNDKSYGP